MPTTVPVGVGDVSDAWLEQLLCGRHGDQYHLAASETVDVAGNQVATCSEIRCVTCRGRVGGRPVTDHLLLKMLPRQPDMRRVVTSLRMAQRETQVYADLLPRLTAFERSRGCDVIAGMTVPCLRADLSSDDVTSSGDVADQHATGGGLRSVIVLENLQAAGFSTPDPVQMPESALPEAIRQLARLAATSSAWLRHCNLHTLPYLLSTHVSPDHMAKGFIKIGVQHLEAGLCRRQNFSLLAKLQRMQQVCTELISRELRPGRPDHRVVTHGDFREGNLLLRRSSAGEWAVRVVDWQVTMISHPAVDLVYLLMLSVPRHVMRRVEEVALRTYLHALQAQSRALGATCPTSGPLLADTFRRAKLLGLMWCLSCVNFWGRVDGWPEHCIDIAEEVDQLGLLDQLDQQDCSTAELQPPRH